MNYFDVRAQKLTKASLIYGMKPKYKNEKGKTK